MFKDLIKDNLAEAYTLHNLKPSTAYKVQVCLIFKKKAKRTIQHYWSSLKMKDGELLPLESQ